jgi:hypothetical protein
MENNEDQTPIQSPRTESLEVAEPSGQGEPEYPTGVKFAAVMIAIALALILVGLDNTILATAIPSVTNHFKTIADIGWYASAYRLTSSSLQFMFGKLYSLFFLVALAIFETGSLIAASAPTSKALIVGRTISRVGSAGVIQGIFTMITQTVPLRCRSMYGGLGAGIESVASVSAPLLGGVLTDNLSWRWCFWISLPLGAVTMVVVGFLFENPRVNPNLSLPLKAQLASLIGYQALLGFSAGIGIQAPQVAAQTILSQQDTPMGIAVVQFMQGLGPAIFVSAAQTLFTARLTSDLGKFAPSLNSTALEMMGLADLKQHIGAEHLQGVLLGYDKAVTQTFYLPAALTCLSFLGTLGMEWRSVKKKRQ